MEHAKAGRVYICKPENSCQGQGIRLIRGAKVLRNRRAGDALATC